MIVRIEYGSKERSVEIDLLETVAARKWLYILNENLKQCNEWKCYSNLIAQYTKVTASAHSKNVAYQKILAGIEGCNKHSEGEKFPYTPKPNMNWTETQLIHRAFTISMTTLKTYSHDLDVSQLMKLKFCDVKERHALMKKWTKRQFTITDIDKFLYYGHMINDGIHEYEPHMVSERSHELKDEGFYGIQIFNHWRDATNKQGLIVSPSEVETSYQHFLDCDVYIDSNIFGKPYLDTYLENDPPLEYDVNNVEVISGEFSMIVGDRDMRKKLFTDSPYQRWLDKTETWAPGTPIPKHLVFPIPLGRIVGCEGNWLGPARKQTIEEWQQEWHEYVRQTPTSVRVKWQSDYDSITVEDPIKLFKDSLY